MAARAVVFQPTRRLPSERTVETVQRAGLPEATLHQQLPRSGMEKAAVAVEAEEQAVLKRRPEQAAEMAALE